VKRPTPAFYDLSRRLLAQEVAGQAASADMLAAAETVFLKLQARLTVLFGQEGFQSVLARALRLAKTEHPLLKGVEVERLSSNPATEVPLSGMRESVADGDSALVAAALAALIASFIWLLVILIGEDIVLRELRRTWPGLPFPEAGLDAEEAER
jgi:hypothetical protein